MHVAFSVRLQVKYVVEQARAMAAHPAVHRVDLLTRRITQPDLDPIYGQETELLCEGCDPTGGARIVRLEAGPPQIYARKEALWPFLREFADNALGHIRRVQAELTRAGRPAAVTVVHGHYADAGEIATLLVQRKGVLGVNLASAAAAAAAGAGAAAAEALFSSVHE